MSVESAQKLSADRRPIDHRHPRTVGARWRVLPTAATWVVIALAMAALAATKREDRGPCDECDVQVPVPSPRAVRAELRVG
jgi:hypothetical protein